MADTTPWGWRRAWLFVRLMLCASIDNALIVGVSLGAGWALDLLPAIRLDLGSGSSLVDAYKAVWSAILSFIPFYILLTLVAWSYYIFLIWMRGQTVGYWVFCQRVVMLDGSAVTLRSSVKRYFRGYVLSRLPFIGVIGWLVRIADYGLVMKGQRPRMARDVVAGTILISTLTREPGQSAAVEPAPLDPESAR